MTAAEVCTIIAAVVAGIVAVIYALRKNGKK